jgi:hypothetical protein
MPLFKLKEKIFMKKISIYPIIFGLILVFLTNSCESYLGGDTNIDPTRPQKVTLAALLPAAIEATSNNHYSAGFEVSQITQQTSSVFASGADVHANETRLDGTWTGVYLRAMSNINVMIQQAQSENAPYYVGIGKILMAINLGLATDIWEDIPYTDAFQGSENLYPRFDSQESIYNAIQRLLDEGITALNQPTSAFTPAADDLIYAGNRSRWIKAANAYKARYLLHTARRTPANLNQILSLVANSFINNSEDFQLVYNDKNRNPWHIRPVLTNNTGNFTISFARQLVDMMNGTLYSYFDPRLPIIASRGNNANFTGKINGTNQGGTAAFAATNYYCTPTAPVIMLGFSELKLIEAEVRFLLNGGSPTTVGSTIEAYTAYLAGIRANMEKLSVPATERDAYLANPAVAVGASALRLTDIMKEKYITLVLHPETWVDMRRYNYNTAIYRDLRLPENQNPELRGNWIRRAAYPISETTRNQAEVSKVVRGLTNPMWWNQ